LESNKFKPTSTKTLFFKEQKLDDQIVYDLSWSEIKLLEDYCSKFNVLDKDIEEYKTKTLLERVAFFIGSEEFSNWFRNNDPDNPENIFDYDFLLGDDTNIYFVLSQLDSFAFKRLTEIVGYEPDLYSYLTYFLKVCCKEFFGKRYFTSEYAVNKSREFLYGRLQSWFNRSFGELYSSNEVIESETSFKGVELNSPPHKKLCEKLESAGLMFFFEAPCYLLGDSKTHRRIDLVVINNGMAVIVEIDGSQHRTIKQKRDDDERDRLIQNNFTNYLRFEANYVNENINEVFSKIMARINPDTGKLY